MNKMRGLIWLVVICVFLWMWWDLHVPATPLFLLFVGLLLYRAWHNATRKAKKHA